MEVLRGGTGEVFICRCRGAEVQRCRYGVQVQRCIGAELQKVQWFRGAD